MFTLDSNTATPTLTVSPKVLLSLLKFAGDATTRPNLAGLSLYIDEDTVRAYMCATDGHVMARCCVPAPDLALLKPYHRKIIARETLEREAKIAKVEKREARVTLSPTSEYQFPDVSQVIPKGRGISEGESIFFAPGYLALIGEFARVVNGKYARALKFSYIGGPYEPAVLTLETAATDAHVEFVLMPMRG